MGPPMVNASSDAKPSAAAHSVPRCQRTFWSDGIPPLANSRAALGLRKFPTPNRNMLERPTIVVHAPREPVSFAPCKTATIQGIKYGVLLPMTCVSSAQLAKDQFSRACVREAERLPRKVSGLVTAQS